METVGYEYGQKHVIEMHCRPAIREAVAGLNQEWSCRLGPDHVVRLDLIGQIAGNIACPAGYAPIAGEGFEAGSRYIPGRNLIMLSLGASIGFRRNIGTLICGASETEYSGYPDCRESSLNAVEAAINLSSGKQFRVQCPLMSLDKKGVWQLAEELGGEELVALIQELSHTCYLGDRDARHEWGYGCGECAACKLRAKGWQDFKATRRVRSG
ncbi:7-cyano-7-deazaguanine synthase [Bradyrhizobium sp. LB13.1]